MNKTIYIFLLTFAISLCSYAQINTIHNSLRAGDIIVKQQVEFKNPAPLEIDKGLIWDFSQVELINNEYTLSYQKAPLLGDSVYVLGDRIFDKKVSKYADLIVGIEHNTMYYYYQTLDSLLLLGHENAAIQQMSQPSLLNMSYPLNYGEAIETGYSSKGLYSGANKVAIKGNVKLHADAYGSLIMPTGDTINPVLRISTEQSIEDLRLDPNLNKETKLYKSYKWYTKGYRYPIFETVEVLDSKTGERAFSTSFYYPPQDHLYLDTDPDNLALLDKLWEYTEEDFTNFEDLSLLTSEKENFYTIYPNPVYDILNIEYVLEKGCPVNIIMATVDGRIVKNIFHKSLQAGVQKEEIECSHLISGVYLIKVVAGELVINAKLIKK